MPRFSFRAFFGRPERMRVLRITTPLQNQQYGPAQIAQSFSDRNMGLLASILSRRQQDQLEALFRSQIPITVAANETCHEDDADVFEYTYEIIIVSGRPHVRYEFVDVEEMFDLCTLGSKGEPLESSPAWEDLTKYLDSMDSTILRKTSGTAGLETAPRCIKLERPMGFYEV